MAYRLFIREPKVLSWEDQVPNPWIELDLGDEEPAMTYQVNDLNELKDRNASFSQRIKLPKNNRNCTSLGLVDNFSVIAVEAYDPRECLLTCDDVYLSPAGALLNIENVSSSIECQIVSPAYDLFKSMDTAIIPFADWDGYNYSLQGLQYDYDDSSPFRTRPIDRPDVSVKHRWPIIFPYKGAAPRAMPTAPYGTIDFWGLVPAVQFLDFVRFALRRKGYKFYSDLIGDAEVERDYITNGALPKNENNSNGGRWSGTVTIPVSSVSARIINPAFPGGPDEDYYKLCKPNIGSAGNSTMEFNAPNPGTYIITLTIDNSKSRTNLSSLLTAYIRHLRSTGGTTDRLGSSTSPAPITTPNTPYIYTFTDEVQVSVRDKILCTLTSVASSAELRSPLITFSVQLKGGQNIVAIGAEGSFLHDTGFKTGLEGLQAFIRTYGVLIDVKRYSKAEESTMYRMPDIIGEVRAYSFNELYRRRDAGVFYDWSNKIVIDESDEQFSFRVGDYAQTNFIELAENTDDNFRDSGSFPVNNKTLPSEKTLFTIPVEAGKDINGFASIPILAATEETVGDNVRTVWNYEGSKPHLVRIDDNEQHSVGIVQGINYGFDESGAYSLRSTVVARHRPASYIVDNHYAKLAQMLHNAKKIIWPFNLDSLDIENFDFLTPVCIEHFGAYFYVSKINNFIVGKPTICELVKL